MKNQIARNCDFTMLNLLKQLDEAFANANTCTGIIKNFRKIEDNFWDEDIELE